MGTLRHDVEWVYGAMGCRLDLRDEASTGLLSRIDDPFKLIFIELFEQPTLSRRERLADKDQPRASFTCASLPSREEQGKLIPSKARP